MALDVDFIQVKAPPDATLCDAVQEALALAMAERRTVRLEYRGRIYQIAELDLAEAQPGQPNHA